MVFTDIRLQGYRSYTDASFELDSGVNIVVGPNAAGKTNLLEAIMVNATGKSYRAKDQLLLKTGAEWARVDVHTSENSLRTVKLQYDQQGKLQKSFEIDSKIYKRFPQMHRYPTVLFEPNDLLLIEDEPVQRRNYFDNLLEQYVSGYDKHRAHYRRALIQRNALLKQGMRASSQLFAWNLRLVDLGEQLVKQRLNLVEAVNQSISTIYSVVARHDKKIKLQYESSIKLNNYSTNLMKTLEASADLDFTRGFTGSGPHRDDIVVYFGDQPAVQSASRGEIRTLVLALKILELQIIEKQTNCRPILLLDDVFSELDSARRKALTDFLKDYQTIITTTDADIIQKEFKVPSMLIAI